MDAATPRDLDQLDSEALKALILALREQVFSHQKQLTTQQEEILSQREQLASRDSEIEHLKPLIAKLPREVRKVLPKQEACPDCGGKVKHLGEDVSEILEYVPASLKVIQYIRPKLACACCDRIVQAAAPSRPIERGIAGPGH